MISDKFREINDYAKSKMRKNGDPDRKKYSLIGNDFGTFAADVINRDSTVDQPSIYNPKPVNIVNEYQEEGNARVNYKPSTNSTTIVREIKATQKNVKKSE